MSVQFDGGTELVHFQESSELISAPVALLRTVTKSPLGPEGFEPCCQLVTPNTTYN